MFKLIVFQGPSGSGKSTLQEKLGLPKVVTCTTRSPRIGEQNGVDYHFIDRKQFEQLSNEGKMLEVTQYKSNLYGTLLDSITGIGDKTKSIVLDYRGAKKIKEVLQDQCFRIGVYAQKEDCKHRIYNRQQSEEETNKRISEYDLEVEALKECEIIINNSDLYWDNIDWVLHSLKYGIVKLN